MKLHLLFLFVLFSVVKSQSQDKLPALDKSPMDISYYPSNYPIAKMSGSITAPLTARIIYSRPAMNGRKIFGGLVEYSKVWRLGANESTEIEFFKDVRMGNTKIKKGRYTMFAIPGDSKWTIILNKELNTWGSFTYDNKKDLLRLDVIPETVSDAVEALSMYFEGSGPTSFSINIVWENTKVSIPFSSN
jgi:hypothetical protein